MSARKVTAVATVLALWLASAFGLATPAAAAEPAMVTYYVVRVAEAGQPETLWDIAARLLGSGQRYVEIYQLNAGRTQPDGGQLTDPAHLTQGWLLVLPWDAVGDGVEIGGLPEIAPVNPDPRPPVPRTTEIAGTCVAPVSALLGRIPWAQLRLAPDRAWTLTRGAGVTIAVIDSGVDADVPALAGRVMAGADVGSGVGPGNRDCNGHGTAMAGIVAAQPRPGSGLVGIAPAASILPIKIAVTRGSVAAADAARAVAVAVSTGARVLMLAAAVDLADPELNRAIDDAREHDVVVVVGATPTNAGSTARDGVLRVGGVSAHEHPVTSYPPGAVDVVAPGQSIITLVAGGPGEVEGTGTNFAVPFVAGLAALVRAAEPSLSAAQVTRRILASADAIGPIQPPNSPYGWGMINPGAAVVQDTAGLAGPVADGPPSRTPFISIAAFSLIALAIGVVLARRRWPRTATPARAVDGERAGVATGSASDTVRSG